MSIVYEDEGSFSPSRKFLVAFYANFRIFGHECQLVIPALLTDPTRARNGMHGKYQVPALRAAWYEEG